MLTLVASALAGGDCIDDADVLRTGGQSPDPGRHGQGAIHPGDVPAQLPVEPRPPAGSGEPGAALDSTSARRQLAPLVPCCLLANRAMRREIAGHRRRKDPPQRIGGPDLGIHPSGVRRLIDTQGGSHRGHYVNRAEHQPQAEHVGHQDPLRRRLTLFTPHSTQIGAAGSAWRCCWTAAAACEPSAATAAGPAGRFAEARRLWRQHRDHAPRHQRHRQGPRVGRP